MQDRLFLSVILMLYIRVSCVDLPTKSEKTANANLVVNNLPSGTKATDIRALVSQYGKVFTVNNCIF